MKNSVVAIAIALLSVEAGAVVTIGDCGVAIAISSEPRFCIDRQLSRFFQRVPQRSRQRKNYNRQACREAVSNAGGYNLSHKRRPTLVVVMAFFNNDAENSPANGADSRLGSGALQRRCLRAAATVVLYLQSAIAYARRKRLEPDAKSATGTSSERGPARIGGNGEVRWI